MSWFGGVQDLNSVAVIGWVAMGIGLPISIARLYTRWKWNQGWKLSDYSVLSGEVRVVNRSGIAATIVTSAAPIATQLC